MRSPGFTLTAILLVTIGIGANVAVFTLANFVLVRPLPFPEPERLTKVWEKHPGYSRMELSPANYRDVIASSTSFTALAAYNGNSMSLVGQGEPQRIEGASVTANLFSTLERPALIGRYFNEKDDQAGAPGTVVLSYALWQTAFGGDRKHTREARFARQSALHSDWRDAARFSFSHARDTVLDALTGLRKTTTRTAITTI